MSRRLAVLLAAGLLCGAAPLQAQIQCWGEGCGRPFTTYGGIAVGDLEFRDPTQLAAESLTNGALTAGTSWTQTADFALASNAATYTHATGSGSFQQTSAAGAIPWASAGINGWFSFTYTVSAVTGAPTCTIPSTFALTARPLIAAAGTYTVVFQAMATTVGDFKVSCTSGAAATITFDTLSLKQVNGGDLTVQGRVSVGQGAAATPSYSFVNLPGYGMSAVSSTGLIFSVATVAEWSMDSSQLYPNSADSNNLGTNSFLVKDFYLARSIQGSKSKSLTDAGAAVAVWRCAIPTGDYLGGEVIWTAKSTDATDFKATQGRVRFAGVNKAGANTCTINVVGTDLTAASSATTLVCTWTNVVNTTNCDLSVTCTDNIAGSQTMTMNSRLDMPLPMACTPQ